MSDEDATTRRRWIAIDVLRLVAMVQMVQGHTIDATWELAARTGPLVDAWMRLRGLTAPAFLFASGLAFAHVVVPRDRRERRLVWRRVAALIVLGYAMHAPWGAPWAAPELRASMYAHAGIVDVLQSTGAALGVALVLGEVAMPRALAACLFAGLAAIAFAAAAPLDVVVPTGWTTPLSHWVSARGGSVFPLVPWAGFVFAGVALGLAWPLPPSGNERVPARAPIAWWATAAVLCAIGYSIRGHDAGVSTYGARLDVALLRLAAVVGFAAMVSLALQRVRRLPPWLERLAGQSLVVYVVHVVLLYAAGVGLAHHIGRSWRLPSALGAAASMLAFSAGCAELWARRREILRALPRYFRRVQ